MLEIVSSLPISIGSSAVTVEGFEISLRKPQNSWTSMAFVDLITAETDFLDFHNLQVENTAMGRQSIRNNRTLHKYTEIGLPQDFHWVLRIF